MKWEKWLYLFAFLCGVICVNICGNQLWMNQNLMNRYHLASLSFREIVYEDYFLYIFFLRFKIVAGVWIGTKLFPKRIIVNGFAVCVSTILGSVLAMVILENGVWGVWFFVSALIPQIFFYMMAFLLWRNGQEVPYVSINTGESNIKKIFLILLILLGCICEAFISPVIIQNVIKY